MKITRSQLRKLINEAYYGPDYEPTVDELKNHPDFQLARGLFDFKGPPELRNDPRVRRNVPGMTISLRDLIDKAKQHPDYPAGSKIARTFEGLKYLATGNQEPDELDFRSFLNLMRYEMRGPNSLPALKLNNILAMMIN
jgi:hypothetical protein